LPYPPNSDSYYLQQLLITEKGRVGFNCFLGSECYALPYDIVGRPARDCLVVWMILWAALYISRFLRVFSLSFFHFLFSVSGTIAKPHTFYSVPTMEDSAIYTFSSSSSEPPSLSSPKPPTRVLATPKMMSQLVLTPHQQIFAFGFSCIQYCFAILMVTFLFLLDLYKPKEQPTNHPLATALNQMITIKILSS
jgi:hypothetical protein